MRTHKYISALLVAASALLSSCTLLVPSPLHYHHEYESSWDENEGSTKWYSKKVYKRSFLVPAEGGLFEFESASNKVYISRIFDSSMLIEEDRSGSNYSPTADDYESVNDVAYSGSFYTITCNKDKRNWVIEVDPIMITPGKLNDREIWVFMRDGSDDSSFVFRFEQYDDADDSIGYLE